MSDNLKRTWAEIDLDALKYNYKVIRERVGFQTKFLGVVKADAYGHGAVQVSRVLQEQGADYLAVSNLEEAMELRQNGISLPILILGHTPQNQVDKLLQYDITQTVTCEAKAVEYSEEVQRLGGTLKVHIKLDTGMSRLGYLCADDHFEGGVEGILHACSLPGLNAEGIFTHFSTADEKDTESIAYYEKQFALFQKVIDALKEKGRTFALCHCANSGAIAYHEESWLDMVRAGIILYGCSSIAKELGLKPVMRLKSNVSTVKVFDADTSISYGRIFTTTEKTRIGVLPIGYADGLFRMLSNQISVWTEDGMARQRGRICMDMCMIELSKHPNVDVGSEVEIFGEKQPVHVLADLAGTISYELTCAVSKRVPRIYYENGTIIERELLLRM